MVRHRICCAICGSEATACRLGWGYKLWMDDILVLGENPDCESTSRHVRLKAVSAAVGADLSRQRLPGHDIAPQHRLRLVRYP